MANLYRIALWNANGLIKRRHEIEMIIHKEKIDILLVTETHFTNNNYFSIAGYKCFSTMHPDGTAHAGTAILIKKSLQHYEMEKYEKSHLQATSIKVTDKNNTQITVNAVYCPPKYSITKEDFSTFSVRNL